MLCVPLTGWVPDHAPEAMHAVALVEDQVIVVLPPLATMLGSELIVTVGAVALAPPVETVGFDCKAAVGALALIVATLEPHADKPKVNVNKIGNSRKRSRNSIGECRRGSVIGISIVQ